MNIKMMWTACGRDEDSLFQFNQIQNDIVMNACLWKFLGIKKYDQSERKGKI